MKQTEYYLAGGIGAALILAFILFGIIGIKTIVAFLIMIFPIYLILDNLKIETDEKIFFSFFLSLAYFSITTWTINRIIPSLKVSIILAFILLCAIGLGLKYLKPKKEEHKNPNLEQSL